MALTEQGFKNHMMHKKNVLKPLAMTLAGNFCVFIFSDVAKVAKVRGEIEAFNTYYGYDISVDSKSNSICLINGKGKLKEIGGLQTC